LVFFAHFAWKVGIQLSINCMIEMWGCVIHMFHLSGIRNKYLSFRGFWSTRRIFGTWKRCDDRVVYICTEMICPSLLPEKETSYNMYAKRNKFRVFAQRLSLDFQFVNANFWWLIINVIKLWREGVGEQGPPVSNLINIQHHPSSSRVMG
jgi:hypothetical protein